MAMPWTDLITQIGAAVRQVLPDPRAQAEFDLKWGELAAQAEQRENDMALAQVEVNKVEASHANLFVSGWRPFIGWVGGIALGYTWILSPIAKALFGLAELPALGSDEIWPIIGGMLGLGTMRTFEKMRGVATSMGGKVHTPRRPIPADLEGLV